MTIDTHSPNDDALAWMCAALCGRLAGAGVPRDVDALWTQVGAHGVGPLLFHALNRSGELERCPAAIVDRLRKLAREHAALEMLRRDELVAVVNALAAAGVGILLMKGTPLAYTHYAAPELRVREDTDALLEREYVDPALDALSALGYRRSLAIDGELVMQQLQMSREDRFGVHHVLDLHWKVSNPQRFAAALEFAELSAASVSVAALGPHARALGDTHALLLACMHRVAHHDASDRLIWLYDVHLLLDALSADARERFAAMAADKEMARVCADGIELAGIRFGSVGARELAERLLQLASARGEASARYLRAHRTGAALLWEDLRALGSWRQRFRLLREHAFPSPRYVRGRFGPRPAWQLPWLYVRRGLSGIRRLLVARRSP